MHRHRRWFVTVQNLISKWLLVFFVSFCFLSQQILILSHNLIHTCYPMFLNYSDRSSIIKKVRKKCQVLTMDILFYYPIKVSCVIQRNVLLKKFVAWALSGEGMNCNFWRYMDIWQLNHHLKWLILPWRGSIISGVCSI